MHISNKLILFLPKLNNIHSQPLSSEIDETDICEASYACAVISSSAHPRCHFNGPRLAIASTCLWVEEALHFCDTVHCRGQSHQTACCCNRKTVRATTSIPRPPLPPECLRMFLGDFVDFFIERSARGNESCPAPQLFRFYFSSVVVDLAKRPASSRQRIDADAWKRSGASCLNRVRGAVAFQCSFYFQGDSCFRKGVRCQLCHLFIFSLGERARQFFI